MDEGRRSSTAVKRHHPVRLVLKAVGLLSVFVVSMVVGALAHLDVRAVRRLVTNQVNTILASLPDDKVSLGGFDLLSVRGVKLSSVDAQIAGVGKGHVSGLTVRINVLGTAWRAASDMLGGKNRLRVEVRSVRIDGVDFQLALGKRPPSPPKEETESKELQLVLDRFDLGHAWIHGALQEGRRIDADIDNLWAKGAMDAHHAEGALKGRIVGRALVPEPVELNLDGDAWVSLLQGSNDRRGKLKVDGRAGQATVAIDASIAGDNVEANVDVPETPAEACRALAPTAPVYGPVSARVHASGTLPRIDFHLEAHAGKGSLVTDGNVKLDEGPSVEAHLGARDVDIAAFSRGGASSRLGLDADAQLRLMPAQGDDLPVAGVVTLRTLPGTVAGKAIPIVTARADVNPARAHATAKIDEPGMPINVELDRDGSGQIRAALDVAAESLADVPLLQQMNLGAKGRVSVAVLATITGQTVDARAQVDAVGLEVAEAKAKSIHVEATAKGPFSAPKGLVSGRLTGLSRGSLALNDLSISARGSPETFALAVKGKGGTLDAIALDANVARGETTKMTGLSGRIVRAKQAVGIRLTEVSFNPTDMAVDGLRIDGLGEPIAASAKRMKSDIVAQIQAPGIELSRVATLLGIDPQRMSGRTAIDMAVEMSSKKTVAKGQIRATAVRYGKAPKIDAEVNLDLDNRALKAEVHAGNPQFGAVKLEVDGTLGALPQQPKAFEGAVGHLAFSSDHLAVGRLCQAVGCPGDLGRAVVSAGIILGAHLDVVRERGGGPDTEVKAVFDIDDTHGRFAHLDADTKLELARALQPKASLFRDLPVEANFSVEPRSLDDLPVTFRPSNLTGKLNARGTLRGSLATPVLDLEVGGEKLQYKRGGRPEGPALDLAWVTKYENAKGTSNLDVRSGDEELVKVAAEVNAAVADFLSAAPNREPRWNASLHADIQGFPLNFVPAMAQDGVRGTLSGKIVVEGIHEKPLVTADLDVDDFRTAREDLGEVKVSLKLDEQRCAASIDAKAGDTAKVMLRATSGCKWAKATVPGLDTSVPVDLALDTKDFPLAALSPAVKSSVERLSGKLDMHVRASGHPDPKATDWALDGSAEVTGANMLPLAVGREIRGLDMKLTLGMDGVKIEKLTGDLGGGLFSVKGQVDLKDRTLAGGKLELHIPRLHSLPVTFEGASYGNVWGDMFADAKVESQQLHVDVNFPTLRFELPPQRTANLESVEKNPAVVVVQPLSPKDLESPETAIAMGGGPTASSFLPPNVVVSLQLGKNVGVSRDDMKVELQTPAPPENPVFKLDGGPHLDGSIRILGGRVPAAGKVFRIEQGTVRFGGTEIGNPSLDIAATYEGEGTSVSRIDIHVGGTVKNIKLTMTSSPPKSQNELLAILAFGDSSPGGGLGGAGGAPSSGGGADSGGQSGTTAAAGAVGGAVLTQGLNQMLSQSIIPVRTSISGTSGSATVDVTERIRVEYIRQFGQSTQNGQPQDQNKVAFDWRFKPRWMLRTQVGDLGTTSLDVLWQHSY
jgi:translocation and assembly module TamB